MAGLAMTRDDIMALANQTAGQHWMDEAHIQRFANLVALAEREILADWMRQHGFSTGQAYTTATLLDRLGTEMVENADAAILEEREACVKVCEEFYSIEGIAQGCAAAIRARGQE